MDAAIVGRENTVKCTALRRSNPFFEVRRPVRVSWSSAETILQTREPDNGLMANPSPNPNKPLWEKGDFTRIAETMRESGEALVQRVGLSKGLQVLDLGCGDGTTAIPAAKLGANVLVLQR